MLADHYYHSSYNIFTSTLYRKCLILAASFVLVLRMKHIEELDKLWWLQENLPILDTMTIIILYCSGYLNEILILKCQIELFFSAGTILWLHFVRDNLLAKTNLRGSRIIPSTYRDFLFCMIEGHFSCGLWSQNRHRKDIKSLLTDRTLL